MSVFKVDTLNECVYYFKTKLTKTDELRIRSFYVTLMEDEYLLDQYITAFKQIGIDLPEQYKIQYPNDYIDDYEEVVQHLTIPSINVVFETTDNESSHKMSVNYITESCIIDATPKRVPRFEGTWIPGLTSSIEQYAARTGKIVLKDHPLIHSISNSLPKSSDTEMEVDDYSDENDDDDEIDTHTDACNVISIGEPIGMSLDECERELTNQQPRGSKRINDEAPHVQREEIIDNVITVNSKAVVMQASTSEVKFCRNSIESASIVMIEDSGKRRISQRLSNFEYKIFYSGKGRFLKAHKRILSDINWLENDGLIIYANKSVPLDALQKFLMHARDK